MDQNVDPLTVKKYFRHVLDSNQSFLTASIQERRLTELSNRISNKMELIEAELTQLAQMITEFKSLERTVKSNPIKAVQPQTSLAEIAQRQLLSEIDRLEKMYLLLSRKASADPKYLATLSNRIESAKKKIIKR